MHVGFDIGESGWIEPRLIGGRSTQYSHHRAVLTGAAR